MKRISILSALLLMCAMTFAQQALWGGAPVVSPEIHDNNTVTFRLKAPKAVKVQVTGDFLPTQKIKTPFGEFDGPGVADLKENKDGVWEFTTPEPLKPELYSYTFLVGITIPVSSRSVTAISAFRSLSSASRTCFPLRFFPISDVSAASVFWL